MTIKIERNKNEWIISFIANDVVCSRLKSSKITLGDDYNSIIIHDIKDGKVTRKKGS
jgi:hypothetical protein